MEDTPIDTHSIASTAIFVLSFLLIGAPIWWKTTEVYRYPIPHDECQQLSSKPVSHSIPVRLVIDDQNVQQGVLWEELLKLSAEPIEKLKPIISFQWSMSSVSEDEHNMINKFQNILELDIAIQNYIEMHPSSGNSTGEIIIYVLSKSDKRSSKFYVGCGNHGYISNDANSKELAKDIKFLVKKMAQSDRLKKLYTPASLYGGDKIPEKDKMRYLKSAYYFDITFSLIVPEPQILEIHWEIENAIRIYLENILEKLSFISNIKVKSQVLYMTHLPIPIRMDSSDGTTKFIVYSEDLPSIINPVESKLGSDASVHPNLNFVIYIPTRQQTPLRIYESKDQPLQSNAFLIPQWGGFMIYNVNLPDNITSDLLPHTVNLNSYSFMNIFMNQFRLLLGLPEKTSLADSKSEVLPCPVLCKWETDFLMRKNAQEQLSSSMSSLSSLSKLLQTIGNIVIKDDIGQKIYFALSSTTKSLQLLSEGKLQEGFKEAQLAFTSSEEAFFDPSLLALLYFPEDQKYAIYIPLFLPISIPVIASIKLLWKYKKQVQQKQKSD